MGTLQPDHLQPGDNRRHSNFQLGSFSTALAGSLTASLSNQRRHRRATDHQSRPCRPTPGGLTRAAPAYGPRRATGPASSSGGALPLLPGSSSNVHFGVSAGTATLDQNFTVATLDFTAGTSGTTNSVLINSSAAPRLPYRGSGVNDNGAGRRRPSCPGDARQPANLDHQWRPAVDGLRRDQRRQQRQPDRGRHRHAHPHRRQHLHRRHDRSTAARCNWATAEPERLGGRQHRRQRPAGLCQSQPRRLSSTISGTGSVVASGPGLLTLTMPTRYSGGTTVAANGTLQLGNGSVQSARWPATSATTDC